jgi:peptide/nickel transport system substrate-binding protein
VRTTPRSARRLAAVLAFAGLTLAACGGDSSGDSTSETTSGSAATTAAGDTNTTAAPEPTTTTTVAAGEFSGDGGSEKPVEGATVSYGMFAEPASYDPHQITAQPDDALIASVLYDTLVGIDANGKLVGQLAESFSLDGAAATFTLREGITCSDGTDVTATVVQQSFERLKALGKQASVAQDLGADFTVEGDDAAGTVTITPSVPNPDVLLNLANPQYGVVCPAGLQATDFNATSYGTGPFVLESVRAGDSVTLAKRDGYAWGRDGEGNGGPGFPAKFIGKVVADEATKANLVISGELSASAFVTADNLDRLDVADFYRTRAVSLSNFIVVSQAEGRPGADPAVRKAVYAALDQAQLAQVTSGKLGTPANGLFPPGNLCYDEDAAVTMPTDPAALAGKELKIVVINIFQAAGEYLAASLEAAGATVDLQVLDAQGFTTAVFVQPDFDVTLWGGRFNPSPAFYMRRTSGPGPAQQGQNFAGITNDAATAAYAKWATAAGQEAQCAAAAEYADAVLSEANVLPYSVTNTLYVGNGLRFNMALNRPIATSLQAVEKNA